MNGERGGAFSDQRKPHFRAQTQPMSTDDEVSIILHREPKHSVVVVARVQEFWLHIPIFIPVF